uniref:Odorant receptor, family C, subfamily 102, member 1 n=1 Tax=Sinocyclocheilus grahami TaxID=75366 RepID=A0A672MI82_SINGR
MTPTNVTKPSETYLIFCNLAVSDLAFGAITLPKAIAKYLFNSSEIPFYSCFVQMFCSLLRDYNAFLMPLMAIDRFVAVCNPLRYCVLITNKAILLACAVIWIICISWLTVIVYHAFDEPYCDSNVITQNYGDQNSIIKLSYVQARYKTFSTCTPQLFIICLYYVCVVYVHDVTITISPGIRVMLIMWYGLLPPVVNPR